MIKNKRIPLKAMGRWRLSIFQKVFITNNKGKFRFINYELAFYLRCKVKKQSPF
jgi:hypothetical protein